MTAAWQDAALCDLERGVPVCLLGLGLGLGLGVWLGLGVGLGLGLGLGLGCLVLHELLQVVLLRVAAARRVSAPRIRFIQAEHLVRGDAAEIPGRY